MQLTVLLLLLNFAIFVPLTQLTLPNPLHPLQWICGKPLGPHGACVRTQSRSSARSGGSCTCVRMCASRLNVAAPFLTMDTFCTRTPGMDAMHIHTHTHTHARTHPLARTHTPLTHTRIRPHTDTWDRVFQWRTVAAGFCFYCIAAIMHTASKFTYTGAYGLCVRPCGLSSCV